MTDQYPPQNPYGQQPGGQPNPYGQQGGAGYTPQYRESAPVGPDGAPPLWAPWYGISFPKAAARFWKKYARFDGRASRSEYWWWVLANAIVYVVLWAVLIAIIFATGSTDTASSSTGVQATSTSNSPLIAIPGVLVGIWFLATLVPNIAIQVRRLHDTNLAGPFWFLSVIPGVGGIVLLVLMLLESKPEGQRFDQPERG